jgi:hypothetical protein
MTGNLRATSLKKRRRTADTMAMYDALPEPLRNWLAGAVLPWSPRACKRIWNRAHNNGQSVDEAIKVLIVAEQKSLT